ncbi:MAG: DMT family transporter [Pseudomonadota bacterium]
MATSISITNTRAADQAANTGPRPFAPLDYLLYALTVASWSVSWYALALQPGMVANEVSLTYRFVIAALIMLAWVSVTGQPMRFPLRQHAIFAAMGVCIFSTNFLLFYYGSSYLVSGLLSVVFSLASLANMLLAALIFGEKPSARIIGAALLGVAGIGLLFWPETASRGFGDGVLTGLGLCIAGTLCFSTGSLISSRMQGRTTGQRVPLVSTNTWGMIYGAIWCCFLAIIQGEPFNWDPRPEYAYSLIFLAVVSTVVAFAAYLTLVGRIGSGRAGYATVVFPVFALLVSTVFEDYRWTLFAVVGLGLVAVGNIIVMRGR